MQAEVAPRSITGGRRLTFTAVLVVAMMAATFTAIAFGILARFLIDDFGISRAQVGGLVTAVGLMAAILSPFAGRFADLIGGRRALVVLLGLSVLGLVGVSLAPAYGYLLAAGAFAGIAQALGNPATNKLIAQLIPKGKRGMITGLKQSGVQFGIFLGGVLLPIGALTIGWRATILLAAVVPGVGVLVAALSIPSSGTGSSVTGRFLQSPPPGIGWLTSYSFLMGLVGGSLVTFLPLFAHEELGMTEAQAGLVVGIVGLVAMGARILWSLLAEAATHFGFPLAALAGVAAVAVLALQFAPAVGVGLLWAGAVLMALSSNSWNSVAMLAVMHEAGVDRAGSASGVVLLGFMSGLGIGPPIFGYSVDASGGYGIGLWALTLLCVLALLVAFGWLSQARRPVPAGQAAGLEPEL